MRRLPLLLVAVLLLALPATAGAMIQLQRGIAGAALGRTQGEVRAALGAPVRVRAFATEFGRVVLWRYRGGVDVSFLAGSRVTNVTTTEGADRTPSGAGVGTTEAGLRRRVGGLRCTNEGGGLRICQLGRSLPGRRVTGFFIRHGHVTRVNVGFVID